MEWIKIDKRARIPKEQFLVTDGNQIDCRLHPKHLYGHFDLGLFEVKEATHYMLISDIKLPDQDAVK
jgi:hypothetical protein